MNNLTIVSKCLMAAFVAAFVAVSMAGCGAPPDDDEVWDEESGSFTKKGPVLGGTIHYRWPIEDFAGSQGTMTFDQTRSPNKWLTRETFDWAQKGRAPDHYLVTYTKDPNKKGDTRDDTLEITLEDTSTKQSLARLSLEIGSGRRLTAGFPTVFWAERVPVDATNVSGTWTWRGDAYRTFTYQGNRYVDFQFVADQDVGTDGAPRWHQRRYNLSSINIDDHVSFNYLAQAMEAIDAISDTTLLGTETVAGAGVAGVLAQIAAEPLANQIGLKPSPEQTKTFAIVGGIAKGVYSVWNTWNQLHQRVTGRLVSAFERGSSRGHRRASKGKALVAPTPQPTPAPPSP